MPGLFWKIWWKINNWKISGKYPYEIKKLIIIIAPHTSWRDVAVGLATRSVLKATHIKFLGKKELFDGPFGWWFRWIGGTAVDRFSKHGVVDQVVDMFNSKEEFTIGLAPEGTRKKVDKLRTGFYHIAKKAGVPILMVGLDFSKKEVVLSETFFTSDNEEKDIEHIISFFGQIKGKYPERGLGHLKKN
ncbi:MAG: 1-acyl-sn-glycerol-3-phosphate acyltransferase [Sphingobacteriales bacterium]|nr:1-acyl-sn-glycerol-3-phosphate acyltransferase [Sphingobacteriales bacterium]